MMENLSQRFLEWLIDNRWWLLALAILGGAGGAYVSRDLRMDRSLERMFAPDDQLLAPYRQLQEAFGEHPIVLAIYQDPDLATLAGLERIGKLSTSAREIPGIVAVVSLRDVPGLLDAEGEAIKTDDRAQRLQEVFAGYTHNEAMDSVGIVCLLGESKLSTGETVDQLRSLIHAYPGGILVGEPVLLGEAFDLLEADGRRLNTWCLGLLLATIFACFRELRWLVLPLVLVQVALALTRGLLAMLDLQLSMVSSMLAAIVTVVGVATVMHVIVRYRDELAAGFVPREALMRAGQILLAPVFFACLTDAVGFASLMISDVKPVVDFGLMMAIGSLMVLVAIALTAPAIILFRAGKQQIRGNHPQSRLTSPLQAIYAWSSQHRLLLTMVTLFVTNGAVIGATKLLQETDFTKNFRQQSELVQSYEFVDQEFGGAGVWDILIPAPRQLDKKYLTKILDFEARLRKEAPGLTQVLSLADALDAGSGGIRKLNFGADMAIRAGAGLLRGRMPEFMGAIYNPQAPQDQCYLRIMLRAPERLGARQKAELIAQVRKVTAEEFPQAQATGFYVLLTQLIESLLRDQWTTFAAATVGIFVVMVLAFRSVPLALVTLIPNVLPVVWLFGAMGWLGVPINMGAAMIAAVSLGLSVDGSIHYVKSYQRLRGLGEPIEAALQSVQATVGRAAVLGTLALVIGFTTLATSNFIPTVYFGTLVSLSMVGGLIGNLVVLPLLIRAVER
ncbi:efflux RND transporter permease subunit [Bythopirellula polymerisocia]|uniref:MMPL family protein n=1 Tax=Bythopirellula polymerisocia TaxID=2528003 RepID=A0A5C6CX20_9BACT|nr:MMPL family transporter [Bythopirellula polymerisocia]TWU28117.1 MMPL family protein [Bythopirellula polymerisocia]